MTILVTGANGFIGSALSALFHTMGEKVIDVGRTGDLAMDVRKSDTVERVFGGYEIEKVVHLASVSALRGQRVMENYLDTNIKGTANVLEACRKFDVNHIVFASSSAVYGSGHIPFSENATTQPSSVYGMTKLAGELLCQSFYQQYGLSSTCLRLFTVYGEMGRKDMAVHTFTRCIDQGNPVNRFGDGHSKRDYVHISDVVDAIVRAVRNPREFEVINIGSGVAATLNELIAIIEIELGRSAIIHEVRVPVGEAVSTQADITKAKKLLGWEPRISLEEGIRQFVQWYKGYYG